MRESHLSMGCRGVVRLAPVFLFLAGGGLCPGVRATVAPPPPPASTVEENEFQEVLRLLKSQYADPAAIKDPVLNRSAINGVLAQLGPGAVLLTQPSLDSSQMHKISSALLSAHVGYWRCPSFLPPKDWKDLETQLSEWNRLPLLGMVIDVRDFEAMNDYAGAAQLASCFARPGLSLFSIQGLQIPQKVYRNPRPAPLFRKPLLVLINRHTIGAAETFAAVMKLYAGAILVGRSTAGQEALYTETRLQSGRYLRLASAQAVLGNGTRLFGAPVVPDIGLYVDDMREREALWQIELGGVEKVIAELPRRKKMNEASLVRDENPEIDQAYAEQQAEKKSNAGDQVHLQDSVLMRALDVLRAIQLNPTSP